MEDRKGSLRCLIKFCFGGVENKKSFFAPFSNRQKFGFDISHLFDFIKIIKHIIQTDLKDLRFFTVIPSPWSTIYIFLKLLLGNLYTLSLFYDCRIVKVTLLILLFSDLKYVQFCFLKFQHCSPFPFMLFPSSFCRSPYL